MFQASQNHLSKCNGKQAQSKKTMFAGFRPIFCFSRAFGLVPFSIVCNAYGEVQSCKIRKIDCLWFAISICVFISLAILNFIQITTINYHQTAHFVLNVGNFLISTLCSIFYVLFYVINMRNRHHFVGVLQNLEIFDKEVSRKSALLIWYQCWTVSNLTAVFSTQMSTLNVHQNHNKEYRRSWQRIAISTMLTLIALSTVHIYCWFDVSKNLFEAQYIVYLISCVVHNFMTFAVFTSVITLLSYFHKRFAEVNSCLRYQCTFSIN